MIILNRGVYVAILTAHGLCVQVLKQTMLRHNVVLIKCYPNEISVTDKRMTLLPVEVTYMDLPYPSGYVIASRSGGKFTVDSRDSNLGYRWR